MKQVIAMYIAVGLISIMGATQASACGFITKLAYNGACSEAEWLDDRKASAVAKGEVYTEAGKYAIINIEGETTVITKEELIKAYNKGGKDAVVALIGVDAQALGANFDEAAEKATAEAVSKAEHAAEQAAKGIEVCFDATCGGKYADAVSASEAAAMGN